MYVSKADQLFVAVLGVRGILRGGRFQPYCDPPPWCKTAYGYDCLCAEYDARNLAFFFTYCLRVIFAD